MVKELVHEFGLYHFRDVSDDFLAGAGHPAGLRVGVDIIATDKPELLVKKIGIGESVTWIKEK